MLPSLAMLLLMALQGKATRAPAPKATPPLNVLLIVVDDVGYADIGALGLKDIPTPNMDRVFKEGVRFSDAYMVASLCGPSRAGIVTGVYPERFGFEFNPGLPRGVDSNYALPRNTPTLAEARKSDGYDTGLIGSGSVSRS